MNVALRALAVGSVVVLAATAAHAADLTTPVVQVAQAQPAAPAAEQQPAPAKKQEKPAESPKAAPAKTDAKPDAKADSKTDAKANDAKAAAPAAAAATAPAKTEEKPLPANISGECAYTGKRIVGLLARDDVDQARKFMDFYRLFSCSEAHIGPTFRCLISDSTLNASAEDINARIDRCWTKQD